MAKTSWPKKLTQISVDNAKPRTVGDGLIRVEIPDGGCVGLYLIVQPSGAKSWAVRFRIGGQPKKLTLGAIPATTLADARAMATAALKKVGQGIDPTIEKRRDKETGESARAKSAADTVENLTTQFIEKYAKRQNRSWKQAERIFKKLVLPEWKGRTVHDIIKRDVIDLVEAIAQDRPILANRALSHVRKFFNWLASRDVIKVNPCAGVTPPGKEVRRERVLDESEIKAVWLACDDLDASSAGVPFGAIAKLLLLTGQRRSEVACMPRSEIDTDKRMWLLPGERTKNGKPHAVPLSRQASAIIGAIPPIVGSSLMFAVRRGFGSYTAAKRRIDERMPATKHWTFHDLRRTCATGMADIGIAPHIIEACLNHLSGHKSGVAGIYNRAVYAAEKADALQRWADHVERIVTGKPAKVIKLRAEQR
jgi:integrase